MKEGLATTVASANPSVPTALVVGYGHVFADPTSRHTCLQLQADGWTVSALHSDIGRILPHIPLAGVSSVESPVPSLPGPLRRLNGPLKAWFFRRNAARLVRTLRPSLVVTITLNDLAALPWPPEKHGFKLACAVLDVPVLEDAGRYDQVLLRRAWERIGKADVVWASDGIRANAVRQLGHLPNCPLVCQNVMHKDYLADPLWPRDGWLRVELRRQGATVGESGGCVVLRAGAIGEYCGIDETLDALTALPDSVIFLMLGRPDTSYQAHLSGRIERLGLRKRAFFWDRPSDEVWKKALRGADVGHMIHGPFPSGRWARLSEYNTSLSNYRLYQYMAAGLPILAFDDPRMETAYSEVPCFRVARWANLSCDLTTHIRELAGDPTLRERLGRAGRAAHMERYNWPVQFAPVRDAIHAACGLPV
jgi:glycosyltransferase involved in cell wall biosynthesis